MYKVIKGEVGGNGGKKYQEGDIVKDTDFPRGNAETLVEMGFLEVVKEETKAANESKSITKDAIMAELTELNVEFNPALKKDELLAILEETKAANESI